ncbi:phage holin [Plantibacter sp. YIM 135347]|uniref:phage holin n=1 Tax=Plantibacter sp. YIM 135347 TaxID=3423919 RepID=UPI003D357FA5
MTIKKPSLEARGYIYRILLAASPIATGYGIVTEQQAGLWLGLAGAVLGLTLAAVNTPTGKGKHAK